MRMVGMRMVGMREDCGSRWDVLPFGFGVHKDGTRMKDGARIKSAEERDRERQGRQADEVASCGVEWNGERR